MHITPLYLALSSFVAVVTALPVDTQPGTVNGGIHNRNPSIPQYNGLQGVFARNPNPEPMIPKGGAAVASKGPAAQAHGPSCPAPKTPLKKPPTKPPTVPDSTTPVVHAANAKVEKNKIKRDVKYELIYRRNIPPPMLWTPATNPVRTNGRYSTCLGTGVWGSVYEDPLNSNQVIKQFHDGSDEAVVRSEISSLTQVGQFAGIWGHMPGAMAHIKTYFVYMRRVPGHSMGKSPLWTFYKGTQYEATAQHKIKCGIWNRINHYASMGFRHPDLYQDNVMLSGTDLDNMSVDFVDWFGMTTGHAPITAAELESLSEKAMQPRKSW